jgi:hypothetical protein
MNPFVCKLSIEWEADNIKAKRMPKWIRAEINNAK